MFFAGIDLGSTITKAVILDGDKRICARVAGATGAEHRRRAGEVMAEALKQASLSLSQIGYIVATGYGRVNVPFADCQVTELTCHARGVYHLFPNSRTAIDIGGQDAKGLKIADGKLIDFVMNDRCAAGTGRFLEITAAALGLKLTELGQISLKAKSKIDISSTCTIFAQSEIVALISAGKPLEDILAGLHDAIAGRVVKMVRGLKIEPDVVFTGGVAKNEAVVKAIREKLDCELLVPQEPLFTGATGAALLAGEMAFKITQDGGRLPAMKRRLEAARLYPDE
ncbi:MAG: acyl-CoA dehydratase activase [Dehalococcoidales bacterium]